jgi:DUF1009 family protein
MFAYLREKEMVLQKDLERFKKGWDEHLLKARIELEVVQSMVIWMAHNFASSVEIQKQKRKKEKKKQKQAVKLKQEIEAQQQLSLFEVTDGTTK